MGGFGAGAVGDRAEVGQADLAAGGQGAQGLAGLVAKQAAAFGGLEQALVDVVVVEGAGGDQVVEVAGRYPQLLVALADRGGGNPGQLGGQRTRAYRGPGPSPTGTETIGASRSTWRCCSRSSSGAGTSASGVSTSRPATHW